MAEKYPGVKLGVQMNPYPCATSSNAAIEVLSIEPGQTPGVIAVVALKVGSVLIRGITVCNRGRGVFVNMPSRKVGDKWIELVEIISPELRAFVVKVILAAVRKMGGAA